ncbi:MULTISPECIES: FmdB family zinc ribbon protein [unclassified Thioalkalivibrio]|uniref:FmdB family zinc ribbon protein n=1 Tax=unclassified Thioalkalivibrio TaxID=2621013 RepID=UPI000360FE6F|nr:MULTISPECIES: zinc ribbon domain-containing protein [unclassified Thioalkalivibrio]
MPIYEYQCKDCGEISEILQKISDPPATTCPECGAEALTKQVSAAGFRLAGGGWYETDFKKDGKRNLKEGSSSSASSAPKSESSSSGSAKTGTAATGT